MSVMNHFAANLRCLFNPESVAVIGALDKPDKLGFHVMKSLTKGGFGDKIIPVNPGTSEIMGIRVSESICILYKSHGDFKEQDARLNNHTRWDNPTTSYVLQQYDSSDGWGTELLS